MMLSSPSVAYGMVVVGTLNGTAEGYDVDTGQPLWTVGSGYGVGAAWALDGAPVVDGVAYMGSDDGKMYALDVHHRGRILWTFQTG